jgi:peptidoglycan/LPS O-acetylase OafA/YrhL
MNTKEQHFPQLDALRGIAALSVLLYHVFGMVRYAPALIGRLDGTLLSEIWNGEAAVLLFLVLSGFVLNLRFVGAKREGFWWIGFLVKRVFRIYPAFLAVMVVAIPLKYIPYGNTVLLPELFKTAVMEPFTANDIPRTLLLVGHNVHPSQFDPPIWSLIVEMRISLVFPAIILLLGLRMPMLVELCILAASLIFADYCWNHDVATGQYLAMFVLGALLAKNWRSLRYPENGYCQWAIIACSLLLYNASAYAKEFGFYGWEDEFVARQLVALGAAGIIVTCLYAPVARTLLANPVAQFMGRTSYSLYLIHYVVLFAMVRIPGLVESRSFLLIFFIAVSSSYALSALCYRYVEAPCNAFGKAMAASIAGRRG